MPERRITFCYRKIIDAGSTRPWDRLVWADTYAEFRLQAQTFDPQRQHRSFGQLLQHAPGAENLHFLVSGAVRGYLQQLGGLVPDVADSLGRQFLRFTQFQFEIINSDLLDQARHQVAVNFFSEPLRWHDSVGAALLLSDPAQAVAPGAPVLTTLFALPPFVSIYSLQTLD